MPIIEIINTTKLNQGKAYVPKRVRDILKIEDGEHLAWCVDNNGQIVITNSKIDLNLF